MLKKITAKFSSACAETGTRLKKGDQIIYNYATKKPYSLGSQVGLNFYLSTDNEIESISKFVEAQENEYFDNFCRNNNI